MVKDVLSFFFYRVALDFFYIFVMQYSFISLDPYVIITSYGMALVAILLAVVTWKQQQSFYIYMLLLSIVLPMTSSYCFRYPYHEYMWMVLASFCVFWGTVFFPVRLRKLVFSPSVRAFSLIRYIILATFFLSIFLILVRYFLLYGTSMFNLNLSKVYNYRFALREHWTGNMWSYLHSWVISSMLPILTAYFLARKQTVMVLCMLGLHVLFFGLSSHKSVLFSGFFIVGLYWVLSRNKTPWRQIPYSAFWGTLFLVIFLYFFEHPFFIIIKSLAWRVFFIPSQVNFWYYDYFSQHDFAYFAHSFMRHLGAVNKYLPGPQFIIGEVYVGNIEVQANTGFLGAGYMEGGFVIMLIYSAILGLFIRFFDKYAHDGNRNAVFAITTFPLLLVFTSLDLPAGIITGGIWLLFITLPFLFPRGLNL